MTDLLAFTRAVSPAFARCELTHAPRVPIDVERARQQHAAYESALRACGCTVEQLPAPPDLPDSVFIEDTAVVLDDIIIITRPGAESRRPETAAVQETLKRHRLLGHITAPGTIDGGDVLVAGRTVFVGQSSRTNSDGTAQFTRLVEHFGYAVRPVAVRGCLHLKSAVTTADDDLLLINRSWADPDAFPGFHVLDVDPSEPMAANVVRVDGRLVAAAAFPKTIARLEAHGLPVVAVDVSEIAKAEGAVTCCSLILRRTE